MKLGEFLMKRLDRDEPCFTRQSTNVEVAAKCDVAGGHVKLFHQHLFDLLSVVGVFAFLGVLRGNQEGLVAALLHKSCEGFISRIQRDSWDA